MLCSLFLLTEFAWAESEIGSAKRVGVGLVVGDPNVGATGKFWMNDKSGVAVFLGTSVVEVIPQLRLNYAMRGSFESEYLTVGEDWTFGQLSLYWHVDVDVGAYFLASDESYARVAVGGGAGNALQLGRLPLEAYVNVGALVGYNGYCVAHPSLQTALLPALCYVRVTASVGVRWYF